MTSLLAELVRRKVLRTAAAYTIVAWLIIQAADVVLPTFNVPLWVSQGLIVVLIFGFPIIVILAWVFDITPAGVKLTGEEEDADPAALFRNKYFVMMLVASVAGATVLTVLLFAIPGADDLIEIGEQPTANVTAKPPEPGSIAVLPLVNLSPGGEKEYFVAGMHDEILSQLNKVSALKITPRRSVLQYRESNASITQIASELGVGAVMEASIRFVGERVRISAQLIRAVDEENIWYEDYEFELDDVFAVQSNVAQSVANAMRVVLQPQELANINRRPTRNTDAYELYLQHWYRAERQNRMFSSAALEEDGWITAGMAELEEAIRLDPQFARGLAELGYSVYLKWVLSPYDQNEGLLERARELAARALESDPELERAYSTLQIVAAAQRRWDTWEEYAIRSVELPDVDGRAAANYGFSLTWQGRFEEAHEWYQVAIRKQPKIQLYHESAMHARLSAGDYQEALAMAERYREDFHDEMAFHIVNAFALHQLGLDSESLQILEQNSELKLTVMRVSEFVGIWNYLRCQTEQYQSIMATIEPVNSYFEYAPAVMCAMGAGDVEKVFALYELQMAAGQVLPYITVDFVPARVRADPRFAVAQQYMNLPKR
jgi:TolB-like protein